MKRSALQRTTRLNPVSDKGRARKAVCADYCRRHPSCETCPDIFGRSPRFTQHPHHILRRSQGGDDSDDNLLAVCKACHRWIHDRTNAAVALARGYIRKRWNYERAS